MTILRTEDADLHHPDGEHIDPAGDPRLAGRLRRHLAAHERRDAQAEILTELCTRGTAYGQAQAELKAAQERLVAERGRLVVAMRAAREVGVTQSAIAEKARLHVRTVQDFLRVGKTRQH